MAVEKRMMPMNIATAAIPWPDATGRNRSNTENRNTSRTRRKAIGARKAIHLSCFSVIGSHRKGRSDEPLGEIV